MREVDENAVGHDALHPAHHHHPSLQLGERRGQVSRLQSRRQQRLLTHNLSFIRLKDQIEAFVVQVCKQVPDSNLAAASHRQQIHQLVCTTDENPTVTLDR